MRVPTAQLTSVNSWNISCQNPKWTGKSIITGLTSLPLLESVELINKTASCTGLPLNQLAGLRRIVLSGYCDGSDAFRKNIVQQLGHVIANCPQLSHLEVKSGLYRAHSAGDNTPTLHDLLGKVSPGTLLPLRHLGLTDWRMRLDSITLPHLKSIASLKIDNNMLPLTSNVTDSSPSHHSDKIPLLDDYSSENHEIWETLQKEGIYPIRITTDIIDHALLNYLASHPGLEELTFTYANSSNRTKSDELANKFYWRVLPKHIASLTKLTIRAAFEGNWCFGRHNVSIISRAQELVHLAVGLNWADMGRWHVNDEEDDSVRGEEGDSVDNEENSVVSRLIPAYSVQLHSATAIPGTPPQHHV